MISAPIRTPAPPSNSLYIIAIIAAIKPDNGPKNNAHKLITIDLPSNIIPFASTNG